MSFEIVFEDNKIDPMHRSEVHANFYIKLKVTSSQSKIKSFNSLKYLLYYPVYQNGLINNFI